MADLTVLVNLSANVATPRLLGSCHLPVAKEIRRHLVFVASAGQTGPGTPVNRPDAHPANFAALGPFGKRK
jgi:hypothetical protein